MDSWQNDEQIVKLGVFDLLEASEQIEHIVTFIFFVFFDVFNLRPKAKLDDLVNRSVCLAILLDLVTRFKDYIFDPFAADLLVQIVIMLIKWLFDAIHKGLCDIFMNLFEIFFGFFLSNPLRFLKVITIQFIGEQYVIEGMMVDVK